MFGVYQEVLINYLLKHKKNMKIYNDIKSELYERKSFKELTIKETASINNEKCMILKISMEKYIS